MMSTVTYAIPLPPDLQGLDERAVIEQSGKWYIYRAVVGLDVPMGGVNMSGIVILNNIRMDCPNNVCFSLCWVYLYPMDLGF